MTRLIKKGLLIFLLLAVWLPVISQVAQNTAGNNGTITTGNIYAVVIGIANYENQNINLNYANRDAEVFADYLRSKAGGAVPSENIRLLIDTNATTAAIYNALNWLRSRCEEDKRENAGKTDLVYFYFSGHGDVETDTKANLGFLLTFNTPINNYINNAVRIEDLNNYAHTLSVDLNANVVIITDACHSGKLAGSDNRGTFLVGKELSTAREKEIRIASCKPDELSNEDIRWGGGRGVFSFYLINGLKGLADKNGDDVVTLNEIKIFVDSSITTDLIIKENKFKQTPILEGRQQFQLASINKEELISLQRSVIPESPALSDQDYFFGSLKKDDRLELINYEKLNALSKDEIPFAFIRQVKNTLDSTVQIERITQLENLIRQDKEALNLFKQTLVDALHTRGQKVINLYLEGDAAELERRRYYNSKSSGYDIYPVMYKLALKLTETNDPLSQILSVNQLYFEAVAARLKIPLVNEARQKQLIEIALVAEKKALALSDQAAYIHNELGILYKLKKEYTEAEKYFTNASLLSPAWSIPWANLCGLYAETKNFEKGIEAGRVADSLQADQQNTNANLGAIYERSGNWLFAEEYYRKAIDINSRHYLPFERLGYVYMNTTQYAGADSFFYEADLRKKGYHFKENESGLGETVVVVSPMPFFLCDVDTLILQKDDILAFFTWGVQEYQEKKYKNAERILKRVIALDKTNPLVFHYMGKIFYEQEKWEEAEVMFKFAVSYWLDDSAFKKYGDSVINSKKYPYAHDCFENFFKYSYYKMDEDYYFLATLYESWAHYEEAETWYRNCIELNKEELAGYAKLWQMLEKLRRYTETEKVIQSYYGYDKERTERELNEFYRRIIPEFPENGDWSYRLGLLLYNRAETKSRETYLDSIIWFPKLNREIFIDLDSYERLRTDLKWDKTINGSPQLVTVSPRLHEDPAHILIPGTKEIITLADAIYTPRKDAITYLLKADSLLTETETKADINFKVGNVFVWSGSKKQAYPYYTRSVELVPGNAAARLNLVDVCKALYKNRAGLEQLDYLYEQQQINFPKRLLYAEFLVHSSQFEKAKKVIEEAQTIHPYVVPETFDLMGRLYLLSGQPAMAIKLYKDYLALSMNDPNILYTIAGQYAKTGHAAEAWKWLEESMKKGFRYSWVLKFDPSWKNFRDTKRWNDLTRRFPVKKYLNLAIASK
ncbi:MAG TPA: caspase family protein [Chitinophagaceae bacterium]|nr:caspase family protein [Chitinophagaceae bacterium]